VGRPKAIGPADRWADARERGGGRDWAENWRWAKVLKEILFEFQLFF
jgi:hypothetical protein